MHLYRQRHLHHTGFHPHGAYLTVPCRIHWYHAFCNHHKIAPWKSMHYPMSQYLVLPKANVHYADYPTKITAGNPNPTIWTSCS